MSGQHRGGRAYSRGFGARGKRKFAPQGTWRRSAEEHHQNEGGGEWFPILQRPHSIPFPSGTLPPKKVRKDEYYLQEKAWEFWGPESNNIYNQQLINGIFLNLRKSNFSQRQVMALEYSQYLERYLWRHFSEERVSPAYLLSISLMVNEKWRQGVPPWLAFVDQPSLFPHLLHAIMDAMASSFKDGEYSMKEHTVFILFLDHTFNSLEVEVVREQVQRLCSLPIWESLHQLRLQQELTAVPRLKKYWDIIHKRDRALEEDALQRVKKERRFLWVLMQQFLLVLGDIPSQGELKEDAVSYCERFLELLIDLEAQLLTRRFFSTLLQANHLLLHCSLSGLVGREPEGHLFKQLLSRLKFYAGFEINNQTGCALTEHEMTDIHYHKITSLQRVAFKLFPELRSFALSNVAGVDTRASLLQHFSGLSAATLHAMATHLCLVEEEGSQFEKQLLLEMLVAEHERKQSQLEAMNAMPLYPTEDVLWDVNLVPSEYYTGQACLALPKLNLQFLTLHDYLLRNFELFRLESTYEIREDIEDAVSRLKPWRNTEGGTEFSGWSRMALPIATFSVVEVGAPRVGEDHPSRVRADITVELTMADNVKREWEGLRKHDVCFLVGIRAEMKLQDQFDWSQPFVPQVGLQCVRGCEVEGMLDENGHVIEEGPDPKPQLTGNARTFRVWLDTNQYQQDMASMVKGAEDVYESFTVIMRRKPKENNFKAVLETIRDLTNAQCVVPDWFHDVFLGYGDPAAALYKNMPTTFITRLNFNDTFLSFQLLLDSFPQYHIECEVEEEKRVPPFIVEFPPPLQQKRKKRKREVEETVTGDEKPTLMVIPYRIPNRGPYPFNQPKKNVVPFTPTQIEAILSGMEPGLTLVVGPPGTGKTDVAVQIISNIYHNFPNQRTLLVTHSNQALNQLFEKIMALDIDERHLLRLGHGEEDLSTDKDFSRYGRVNFILALRMKLLKEVERLQASVGVAGDVSYTCETASHFFLYQVAPRWDKFYTQIKTMAGQEEEEEVSKIAELFPFTKYFSTAPQPLFMGQTFAEDVEIAEGCYRHLKKIFKQLEGFRAFELLRSGRDRINYLMVREAKIVAMTCTHAALKRRDMVDLSFKYDNVLMEEAAQILEVETFIPLMLQNPLDGHNRLKRVIMIGDHHQLPPVIKNMSFQKYSNMEQSMFTRFVRLGVPTVQLDGQGRARPSLCSLYKWRYKNLGDLPHVQHWPDYRQANAGMLYDYQLIDVSDFNGVGETEPTPHFIQNLGEAEYAVALFMYLRLQGYPPEKIAILTTYNGQKHLIRDVLSRRCAKNSVFGLPEKVTTVDRYQGQQNDYIILSLVRTKLIGHIRDVRRLVVAMSRARLGLYIFGRVSLFQSCTELQPAFQLLLQRPRQLHLLPDEFYPTPRKMEEGVGGGRVFVVAGMPQLADYVYQDYQVRMQALQRQVQQRGRDALAAAALPATIPTQQEEEEQPDTSVKMDTPTDALTMAVPPTQQEEEEEPDTSVKMDTPTDAPPMAVPPTQQEEEEQPDISVKMDTPTDAPPMAVPPTQQEEEEQPDISVKMDTPTDAPPVAVPPTQQEEEEQPDISVKMDTPTDAPPMAVPPTQQEEEEQPDISVKMDTPTDAPPMAVPPTQQEEEEQPDISVKMDTPTDAPPVAVPPTQQEEEEQPDISVKMDTPTDAPPMAVPPTHQEEEEQPDTSVRMDTMADAPPVAIKMDTTTDAPPMADLPTQQEEEETSVKMDTLTDAPPVPASPT